MSAPNTRDDDNGEVLGPNAPAPDMVAGSPSPALSLGDRIREALLDDQIEATRLLSAIADFSVDSGVGRGPMPSVLGKRGPDLESSELAPAAKRRDPGNGPEAANRQRAPITEPEIVHIDDDDDDDDQSRHSGEDTDSSDDTERVDAVYGALDPIFEQASVLIERAIERIEALSDSMKALLAKLDSVCERTGSTEKWLRMYEKWEVMIERLDALSEKESAMRMARCTSE